MRAILRAAGSIANLFLSFFNLRLVSGPTRKPWHNPTSPTILHSVVTPGATYSPWLGDAEFTVCYERVRPNTLVDIYRCYEIWELGKQLMHVPGDYLEVGVWRGGTGCLLASTVRDTSKITYLADTFTGVVKAGSRDRGYSGGEHADTSSEIVEKLIDELGLKNTQILRGVFPDDVGSGVRGPIALLHCDVDVYQSAKDTVEWTLPRLARGGVMIFDDYGFRHCTGVTRLVNELRTDPRFFFVHNLNGHALLFNKYD